MYQLYNQDCFEILKGMPDKSVAHVITDPPYGERTHKGAKGGSGIKTEIHKQYSLIDFESITKERFFEFCNEAVRVANRWVIMTCEWRYAAQIEEHSILGKYFIRCGIWRKPNACPQFTGDRPGNGWEAVLILHREGKKRWNGGGHHAFWEYPCETGLHPTQKPLGLIKQWVDQFTDRGETIFDPFMGSGTTGVAVLEMGRNFIGIEIDKKYFEIAKKRIETVDEQIKLFE
jgi:site-specific DNA-methyltransferase (adenine-specific)